MSARLATLIVLALGLWAASAARADEPSAAPSTSAAPSPSAAPSTSAAPSPSAAPSTSAAPSAPSPPPSATPAPPPPPPSEKTPNGAGGSDVVSGAGTPTDPAVVDATPVRVESLPGYPPEPRQLSLGSRLDWRWPQFSFGQYALTAGQAALAVGAQAIPGERRFNGVNAFDDAVRNALRLDDYEAHLYARDASDVGFVLLVNHRLIDTLLVTWWFHDKGSTAFEMGLLDLQALTFAAGVQQMTAGIAGRERPYGRAECGEGGRERETTDCLGNNRYRSFFSGHTTLSFTLASLTCMHHAHLPIYGGGAIEAVPCVASMAVASAVSTLRIVADQHYATDVLLGVAFGLASGLSIPYLFAYGQAPLKEAMQSAGLPKDVFIMPTPVGVAAGGLF